MPACKWSRSPPFLTSSPLGPLGYGRRRTWSAQGTRCGWCCGWRFLYGWKMLEVNPIPLMLGRFWRLFNIFQPSKCFGGADLTCGQDKPWQTWQIEVCRRNMFGDILSDAASVLPGSLGPDATRLGIGLAQQSGGTRLLWIWIALGIGPSKAFSIPWRWIAHVRAQWWERPRHCRPWHFWPITYPVVGT